MRLNCLNKYIEKIFKLSHEDILSDCTKSVNLFILSKMQIINGYAISCGMFQESMNCYKLSCDYKVTQSVTIINEFPHEIYINLKTMQNVKLQIQGRHGPCMVSRAVPCIKAAAAIATIDSQGF